MPFGQSSHCKLAHGKDVILISGIDVPSFFAGCLLTLHCLSPQKRTLSLLKIFARGKIVRNNFCAYAVQFLRLNKEIRRCCANLIQGKKNAQNKRIPNTNKRHLHIQNTIK